mmetsp:Transcript_12805/g.31090  ORF Transcript_12805/g.31090 Transcript_12805/m.31090 type:complete len:493 (+) Transcript_12805:374-1852(+)|eukprot:CAMPEP_0113464398 /NCGR_PEP_ID=MMETSP0014_2-20120614/13181_1 /TAXON_ID=2857 /ORGANISM="Nitzschia sp." /LENGTH=492 /DNA_ID=CAMNT_0000356479 /DNA_START=1601 /DNA_END=3079 /DNA_ORIENTATION=+ /assembly_acc=CAM_ASM_000159
MSLPSPLSSVPYGLLKGVDLTTKDWYTDDLSIGSELDQIGFFPGLVRAEAAARNCTEKGYISELLQKFNLMMSKGEVFDREEVRELIDEDASMKGAGNLKFITGSRNVGKTRILKEMARKHNEDPSSEVMIVYVNGRIEDLSEGIKKALVELKNRKWYELPDLEEVVNRILMSKEAIVPIASTIVSGVGLSGTASAALAERCGAAELLTRFKDEKGELGLVDLIGRLAEKKNKYPCLIIDEANRIVTSKNEDLVATLVSKTKEEHQMNIFLSTSIHSYPGDLETAYHIQFSSSYYIEEFPPTVLWEILTEMKDSNGNKVIGMGESLASAFITAFGGNLMLMQSALADLRTNLSHFSALQCIRWHVEGSEQVETLGRSNLDSSIKQALMALGQKGVWIPQADDPQDAATVETLVKKGVASKLRTSAVVEGSYMVPADVRDCLVPSSQALRNLIVLRIKPASSSTASTTAAAGSHQTNASLASSSTATATGSSI